MPTFCNDYLAVAGDLAYWAKWFLVASLVTGLFYALAELAQKFRAPPSPLREAPIDGATAIKEIAGALRDLITALATAPIWLGLFAAGILLFVVVSNSMPTACQAFATPKEKGAASNQANPNSTHAPAPGGSTSNTTQANSQ